LAPDFSELHLMRPDIQALEELVRQVAREELMPRFKNAHWEFKADGSIVSEADFAVQNRFVHELEARFPLTTLLGEEMDEETQRELARREDEYLWCLDPLDGTNNFAVGFPYFCISLALLKGSQPIAGIVYDPNRDECFSALKGEGAWLNGRKLRVSPVRVPLERCIAMIDFKRLPKGLARGMAERAPVGSWRYTGAGALEWCWLAAGRFHAYLHGRQKLWDFAAGALIFSEAGGISETLEGEPLYAPGILSRSVVAAPDPAFFGLWRKAIDERCLHP
jgi:myo-inositol-1(or 4)-monophosphatase